jgi:hypothetical protein
MVSEDTVSTELPLGRESDLYSEALPFYLQEIGRVPLLTADGRLQRAPGARCPVELVA